MFDQLSRVGGEACYSKRRFSIFDWNIRELFLAKAILIIAVVCTGHRIRAMRQGQGTLRPWLDLSTNRLQLKPVKPLQELSQICHVPSYMLDVLHWLQPNRRSTARSSLWSAGSCKKRGTIHNGSKRWKRVGHNIVKIHRILHVGP